ncbi:MAG TPA: hypothetical protein EYQ64_08960 [Gemmatimonadetes bacterium]|nr:hypothetical protein [Gemmatimonadota bacterium]
MLRTLPWAALAALTILGTGCSGGVGSADTLTRRQKNEIISTLPIPGARGVGRALEVSDRAQAQAAQHDSIARQR